MNSTHNFARDIAERLALAYQQRRPIPALPKHGPTNTESAYATQRAVWQTLVGEQRPRAWKVGASSPHATPTAAPVFPQRLVCGAATFPTELLMAPGVEAEIALCFGADLPPRSTCYAREEILAAIASAHVAMELVDTRLTDSKAAGPLWCLADSLLNGGLVVGDAIANWRKVDWSVQDPTIRFDGQLLPNLQARPPLADIFHCLPWWIDHIGGVRAGDIVTTGAWSGMHPLESAQHVAVEFVGLGRAEVSIA